MSVAQWALAILGVGALIAWHELGHYLAARLTGMRVLKYSIGFGPRLWGFEKGGIEYRLSAIPLGGYVHIFGMTPLEPGAREDPRSFLNAPRWARLVTILAGPAFNYLLAFVLFGIFFASWPGGVMRLEAVEPSSPLAAAGVEAGDRVVSVDGRAFRTPQAFLERFEAGRTASLVLVRGEGEDARRVDVALEAREGGRFSFEPYEVGLLEAGGQALSACWTYSVRTLEALGRLVAGDKEARSSTAGPPGIVVELKEAVSRGLIDFLWLLAFVNLSLGLFNLLPIPALDGIKALVLVVEGVMRREVNPVAMAIVNLIGLVVLMGLIVALSVKDIAQMFG